MGFFRVNRPRQFNYVPRYYDPEQEARAQRRRELLGEDPLADKTGEEYSPGQFIRRSVAARRGSIANRKERRSKSSGSRIFIYALILALVAAMFYLWK